ncbi:MAG TPA: T9SS type A sorting domain-containing protein, partial [Chitinophagales bacterium]|nr:T9SS type A sorting domain-containing protein [Chitinophagales bacterium]
MKICYKLYVTAAFVVFTLTAYPHRSLAQCTPPSLTLSGWDAICGFTTGSVVATITGGMAPYSYTWNTGASDQDIDGLPPGNYCLTVTDALGCTATSCYAVSDVAGIDTVIFIETADTAGFFSVQANVVGGTAPYTFIWSNGPTWQNLSQLSWGTYGLTVTDANGCWIEADYTTGTSCATDMAIAYSLVGNIVTANVVNPDANISYTWSNYTGLSDSGTAVSYTISSVLYQSLCLTAVDDTGCTSIACETLVLPFTDVDTISGKLWRDNNSNGLIESSEPPVAYTSVHWVNVNDTTHQGQQYLGTADSGQYKLQLLPGTYKISVNNPPTNLSQTFPASPSFYTVTLSGSQSIANVNFGFKYQGVTINGVVFADLNGNGTMDGSETGIPNYKIKLAGTWQWTDANGFFAFYKSPNTYTLQYDTLTNPGALTSAASYTVAATIAEQTYGPYYFGVELFQQDLKVVITPLDNVIPGFLSWYEIKCMNVGSLAAAGDLSFVKPDSLEFASFVMSPTYFNGDTATWTNLLLQPNSHFVSYAYLVAPVNLTLGTDVISSAFVVTAGGDDFEPNDSASVTQTVVGSFDPNDKAVSPPGTAPNGAINPDDVKTLTYTVRFQNTGTWYATNVILIDTLSAHLDWNSIKINDASHTYTAQLNDTTGVLTFFFTNIMLPDSNTNEPESHGYVQFEMNLDPTLALGTVIENFVDIYFDFNEPVRTNTVVNTLAEEIIDAVHQAVSPQGVFVYPNPANGAVRIQSNGFSFGTAVTVYNVLGTAVSSALVNANGFATVARGNLPSGVYFFEVAGDNV